MSIRDLINRWFRDNPVPWDASNPLGEAIEVTDPNDTPLGFVCFQHIEDGMLMALTPGTRICDALRAVRLADGREAWQQVHLPTRREPGA